MDKEVKPLPTFSYVIRSLFSLPVFPAASPDDQRVGNDDLGGQKVRVLDMVDQLRGGLNAQLEGVDIHRGQLRGCDAGKEGVVKRDNGQIFGNGKSLL